MRLATTILAAGAAAASTLAIAASTSPLTPPPPSGAGLPTGQCIRTHDFRNHTVADRNTLLVDVGGKGVYRITMRDGCLNAAISSDPIVTHSPPGASIICKPIDLDISIARAGGFPSRCIVDSIVKMAPEEVAALPRRVRP